MENESINQFIRDCINELETLLNEIKNQKDKIYPNIIFGILKLYFYITGPFLFIEFLGFVAKSYTIQTLPFKVLNIISIIMLVILGIPSIYYGQKLVKRRKKYNMKWQQLYQKLFVHHEEIETYNDKIYIDKLMNSSTYVYRSTNLSKYSMVMWNLYDTNNLIEDGFLDIDNCIEECINQICKEMNKKSQTNKTKEIIKKEQSNDKMQYAEYLNLFEEIINEMIRKQMVLNNIPNNQALISKLKNIIDINVKSVEKLSQNTQLILELDDNTKSANTLKKVKDNQEKAQSIYEDIEKLIFKTMEVIESDDLNNEIQNNETFERILDDYQQSKF